MSHPFIDRIAVLGRPDSRERYHAHAAAPWSPETMDQLVEFGFTRAQLNLAWDGTTGPNTVWQALLPNWGLGCPVEVSGRVFVGYCYPAPVIPTVGGEDYLLTCSQGRG